MKTDIEKFSYIRNSYPISGAASVARAWSGYVDSLIDGQISSATKIIFGEFYEGYFSKHPDLLSFFICILYSIILGKT